MIYYQASDGHIKTLGDNELQHWKYIKKIPAGSGYRYFYSMDEWRAYLADPTAQVQKTGQKAKKAVSNARRSASKDLSKGRKKAEKFVSRKFKASTKMSDVRLYNSNVSKDKRSKLEKFRDNIKTKWNSGKKDISEKIEKAKKWIDKLLHGDPEKKKKEEEKKEKKRIDRHEKYKYIFKKKINGKTRYFYSKDELDAYNKRSEYQKNEPEYLKKLKHSEDPYTAEEDAILVNPRYDFNSNDVDYTTNCAECTAIYELRRRGYDVESNGVAGESDSISTIGKLRDKWNSLKYNTDARFKLYYENPNVQTVENTKNDKDTARVIREAIDKNPPGSRGDLSVQWKDGGGHSVVWEKDSNGKIHIIDTQISGHGGQVEYDLDDFCSKVDNNKRYASTYGFKSGTRIVRTDNLTLKKDITKICRNSSNRKPIPSKDKYDLTYIHSGNYSITSRDEKEMTTKYPVLSEGLYEERRRT